MTRFLVVPHREKCNYYGEPVEIVRDDRAVRGGVLPAEKGIEDSPASTAVE